jgi:hypothetical protein
MKNRKLFCLLDVDAWISYFVQFGYVDVKVFIRAIKLGLIDVNSIIDNKCLKTFLQKHCLQLNTIYKRSEDLM